MKLNANAAGQADREFSAIVAKVEGLDLGEIAEDLKFWGLSERDLAECLKFLALKVYTRDYDAILLSPTPTVDQARTLCLANLQHRRNLTLISAQVWHVMMLNPTLYATLCETIAGRVIGHRLSPNSPPEPRQEAAAKLYSRFFGPPPVAKRKRSDQVELLVQTLTGKTHSLTFSPTTTVRNLMDAIKEREGVPPDQQRFIFNGDQIDVTSETTTLVSLGVRDGSMLHFVQRMRGC